MHTLSRVIWQIRYNSSIGITSSWAAIWNTESAEVYTIGLPVLMCSDPRRSIISVPDATSLPK